jgi:putative endonuclease
MRYYIYMLASGRHGTLYVGVTVWYEAYEQIADAIAREKELRKWHRDWKIRLIEEMNPEWEGLSLILNQ